MMKKIVEICVGVLQSREEIGNFVDSKRYCLAKIKINGTCHQLIPIHCSLRIISINKNCDQLNLHANSNHTITTIPNRLKKKCNHKMDRERDKNRFSRLHNKHRKRNITKIMLSIHDILYENVVVKILILRRKRKDYIQ